MYLYRVHASLVRVINTIIKLTIGGLLILLLYKQLHTSDLSFYESISAVWDNIKELRMVYLLCIILLMPLNWYIEAHRFKVLLSPVLEISISLSIKCVCSGLSLAAITPNRIGEYAGRIIPLASKNNVQGMISTFVGSLAQNIINIGIGALGGLMVLWYWLDITTVQLFSALACILLFLVAMLYLYFHLELISRLLNRLKRFPWIGKYIPALSSLEHFDRRLLSSVIGLSFLRYLVYTTQYILLIYAFEFDIEWYWVMASVACIYLLQTGFPIPPLLGILARAEIAILIWGIYIQNHGAIVMATLLLWIINIILPSLIGLFFVSKENILTSIGIKNRHHHPS